MYLIADSAAVLQIFKWAIPDLFLVYFVFFKQTIQFYNNMPNTKNIHPVSGADIQTSNLFNSGLLPSPLDQGSHPIKVRIFTIEWIGIKWNKKKVRKRERERNRVKFVVRKRKWKQGESSVTRKELQNVYKSCPNMISLEKWYILTHLQKLPKNVAELGKLIVAKGFEKLPKVQQIAQSGHTGPKSRRSRRLPMEDQCRRSLKTCQWPIL